MTVNETIQHSFAADHVRLEKIFNAFQEAKRVDFRKGKEAFKQFLFGLQRHIVWEENILFPLFEKKTGMHHSGPTEVMRQEHLRIKQYLEAIHARVACHDPESDEEEAALTKLLAEHDMKEETILYPAIDRMSSAEEKASVFEAMSALPESAYAHCCSGKE